MMSSGLGLVNEIERDALVIDVAQLRRMVCPCRLAALVVPLSLPGLGNPAVYNRAMGLFGSRARKKREKAAELLKAQANAAEPQEELARRKVTAKARVDPDQPGWGRAMGQEIAKAREARSSQQ